jgi:hypothetical protein
MLQLHSPTTCFSLDIDRLDGRGPDAHFPSAHSKNDKIPAVSRRLKIFTRISTVAKSFQNE